MKLISLSLRPFHLCATFRGHFIEAGKFRHEPEGTAVFRTGTVTVKKRFCGFVQIQHETRNASQQAELDAILSED